MPVERPKVTDLIIRFMAGKEYFSLEALKNDFKRKNTTYKPTTLKQYLYNYVQEGKLFDAGRGWYSTISCAKPVDVKPVSLLSKLVRRRFPRLHFSLWRTSQLRQFENQERVINPSFLYTQRDSISTLTNFLRSKQFDALPNPHKDELHKFFKLSNKTIIVRSSISEEPSVDSFATMEKILVDLFIEKDRATLMKDAEYERIFRNVVRSSRINIARLLRYASRRQIRDKLVRDCLSSEGDIIALR
jgi:hypothetical protein